MWSMHIATFSVGLRHTVIKLFICACNMIILCTYSYFTIVHVISVSLIWRIKFYLQLTTNLSSVSTATHIQMSSLIECAVHTYMHLTPSTKCWWASCTSSETHCLYNYTYLQDNTYFCGQKGYAMFLKPYNINLC